jgi:superfamily II DNA or RNA helicase
VADPDLSEQTLAGPGETVRARRVWWRVAARRGEADITRFDLQPDDLCGDGRTLLTPFDRIERLETDGRLARVSRRRGIHRLAAMVAESRPFELPATAAAAPVRLLPFQIEPLLTVRRGLAARVLIADHVGLGKTIQAALIARDLVASLGHAAILILTPAGLRDQWRTELHDRAGLTACCVDHDVLRARAITLPPHVNPWLVNPGRAAPIVIASIDFVKQPDVLHGLTPLTWDLLIVDEAHTLTLGSDRLAAADALARRSDRLVLLTATPHDGREDSFRALCELGRVSASDVLATFRRTRAMSGATHRRVTRRLVVRPTDAERRVHALLERYARRVWSARSTADRRRGAGSAARLAMTVLFKRAASSATSLAQSLERRRALLFTQDEVMDHRDPVQTLLPLARESEAAAGEDEDDEAPGRLLAAPGLAPERERTWLNLLVHAAQAAARGESKVRALVRLIRRVREPIIVFTEYRDTLARLEGVIGRVADTVTIHGGRSDETRREALRAFDSGAARVLLATDAASVGLNLHSRCRLVVHVELPWSPTRIEQRIGRVDRLGQTRTVHSLHLVADAAVEASIEARLIERAQRIRDALDGVRDNDGDPTEWLDAALHARPVSEARTSPVERRSDGSGEPARRPTGVIWPQLREEAEHVVRSLEQLRRLGERCGRGSPPRRRRGRRRPFVVRLRRASRRHDTLPRGSILVYRTRITRTDGASLEQTLTVVHVDAGAGGAQPSSPSNAARRVVDDVLGRHVDARCVELSTVVERTEALVRVRHREAIARAHARPAQVQLPLFAELISPRLETDEGLASTAPHPNALLPPGTERAASGERGIVGIARLAAVLLVD